MKSTQRYQITITGRADPLFIPALIKDAIELASENGSVRVDIGHPEDD